MSLKRVFRFALDNYFVSLFLAAVAFVVFVSLFKIIFSKPTYVFAKVKMGQGLWWATTAKPSIWYVKAVKKGEKELDLLGQPIAEIINIRYYPWEGKTSQFDAYLTLKLKVSGNKRSKKYSFKRSTIGVGAPIELEFPSSQVSGTIIELSETPLRGEYIEKIVILTKKNVYPWEFDAITIRDKYFDGEDVVFEITDKAATDTSIISQDIFGNFTPSTLDTRKYISVKTKMKLRSVDNQLVFGEDQVVSLGKTLNVSTPNFTFQEYAVSGIEE